VLIYNVILLVFLGLVSLQDPTQIKIQGLIKDAELSPDDTAKVSLLIKISGEHMYTNSSIAIDYAQQALALAEKLGDQAAIDRALLSITMATYQTGLHEITAKYMLRALNSAIERKDYLEIGRYYFNLGSLNHVLGNLPEAESYLMKGWKMIDSIYTAQGKPFPKNELATIYNNLGYIKWSMQDYEESERYYLMGLEVGNKDEINSRNFKNLHLGLANVYFKTNEYNKIKPLLDVVLELQQQENDRSGMIITYRLEGDLYEQRGQYPQAIQNYRQAWTLANEVENLSLSQYTAEGLQAIYEKMGVADSALKYLSIVNTLKEQSKAKEANQELLRAELTREFEARELGLQKAAQSKTQRLTIIIFVIAIVTLSSVWLFIRFRNKYRLAEAERKHIEELVHQSEHEAEILKADLERKDKELTTQVIYSIQKNEMITDLVEKLQNKSPEDSGSQQEEMRKIIKTLEKTTDQGVWEEFELRFQQVHAGFYERLYAKYPGLSQNERRLCAFLLLDMSTKEIASITGQTVRAVEMARIRLRKKMNLTKSDTSLYDILTSL
jgi:tetratricopeptide (TPR) repeat protein